MIYFLESRYMKKLFSNLCLYRSDLILLPRDQIQVCTHEDLFVLDEKDIDALPPHIKKYRILGEGKGCISKYQPYHEISKQLFNDVFPSILVTSNYLSPERLHTVQMLWQYLDFDYFVDCTLNTENAFSIYNFAMNPAINPEKKRKYAPIAHLKDALNPPVKDVIHFIKMLKQTGRTFIFSAPLKGALDNALIEHVDLIINLNKEGETIFNIKEKPCYTIPIVPDIKSELFFEKHIKYLLSDLKHQWGGHVDHL